MKAWDGVLRMPTQGRSTKPRKTGWTMVIDRGLGLCATRDLVQTAADYVDDVKLTFGTSGFYDSDLLKEKVKILTGAGVDVQPGGTIVEVAAWQGAFEKFLERAAEIGFTLIEVADGSVRMPDEQRRKIIQLVKSAGFKVTSEVGSKDPNEPKPMETLRRQIALDLECGVFKVLIEAKEGGVHTTIYDDFGNVKEDVVERIVAGFDPDSLVWEAPAKDQQQWLIRRFGVNVNLANIGTGDALALEALRNSLGGYGLKREYLKTSGQLQV